MRLVLTLAVLEQVNPDFVLTSTKADENFITVCRAFSTLIHRQLLAHSCSAQWKKSTDRGKSVRIASSQQTRARTNCTRSLCSPTSRRSRPPWPRRIPVLRRPARRVPLAHTTLCAVASAMPPTQTWCAGRRPSAFRTSSKRSARRYAYVARSPRISQAQNSTDGVRKRAPGLFTQDARVWRARRGRA